MWQSRVEIEDYSVKYFDHIALFFKRHITELLLRVGLIRASQPHTQAAWVQG